MDTKKSATKIPCPDCGNAPVNHFIEKASIFMYWVMTPLNVPFEKIWNWSEPLIGPFLLHYFIPFFFRALLFFKLGKRADSPDEKTAGRARAFWEEAKRRGIDMWEFQLFGMGRELFVANFQGKEVAFDGLPRPGKSSSESIMWMDNKGIMRQRFEKAHVPIARGGVAFSWRKTKKLFEELEAPVIIKPNLGSRSRHTTTHIMDLVGLEKAFKNATMLSPWVIVEEEHVGFVHRATVIGGKLIGVLRREPPVVYGDGIHTISELIEIENKDPLRAGPIFHKLETNQSALEELARQNITLETIPKKDTLITLGQKASRGIGGGATDVTEETHPDNKKLFEYIAQEVLKDSLVGIDFIIDDISKSWREQKRSGVIECNSLPFIELHLFPLKGKPRDTVGALWDLIFPQSGKISSKT